MEDSKVIGKLTRIFSEVKGKSNLVVNIEASKNEDLWKRKAGQNVFYFGK